MRFIDLFAGLGGFHQALNNLGHECVFASDIDKQLIQLYKMNFGIEPEVHLTIGGYTYWTMNYKVEATILINRTLEAVK